MPVNIHQLLTRSVDKLVVKKSLEKKLKSKRKLRVKLGVDPSAPEIHLGIAVALRKLREFQQLGHQVIFIVGDFTARIGDPTGRKTSRKPLTKADVERNMKDYKRQVGKIIDLQKTEFRYNSEWLAKMDFENVLKLCAKATHAQIIAREDFQNRIEQRHQIGMHELMYPLMQAYDSVVIKADIEIGGTDQLFNVLIGRDIQKAYNLPPQDIMTLPILEGTDGILKMSKSIGNTISIVDTPNEMYGKLMSIPDQLILKYFELCTDTPLKEITEMERALEKKIINPKDLKERLAIEITTIYHNEQKALQAQKEFSRIFKEHKKPSKIPSIKVKEKTVQITDLLVKTDLSKSKSEARRLIEQGAVKINDQTVKEWKKGIEIKNGLTISVGKRKFIKIET